MIKRMLQDEQSDTDESLVTSLRKRPYRFLVAVLFLINISLIAVNGGLWVSAAIQRLFIAADFTAFYTGYTLVREGEGEHLYDWTTQAKYQQQLVGDLEFVSDLLPFINPPHVALIFSFLSLFSLMSAFYIWSFVQFVLLLWFIISINKLFQDWSQPERFGLITVVLAFWPLAHNFLFGQFSLILLISFLQMYISMKNSKYTQAGFWLAVITIKPHMLLIPGMITLNKRYWRIAATTLITCFVLFIITSIFLGITPWIKYFQFIQSIKSYFDKFVVFPKVEYSFQGILSNVLGDTPGNLINIISGGILLAGMIFVWFLWRKGVDHCSPRFPLYFAFTVLLTVFLSLHLNPYDSLILVLPAALLYDYLRRNHYPKKALTIILLVSPVIYLFAMFYEFNIFGVIRPPVGVILILFGWMIYYTFREIKADRGSNMTSVISDGAQS